MANYDGTVWDREGFTRHINAIPTEQLGWIEFGALHNTGSPNMAQQRATKGGASQRMKNAKVDVDKRLKGKGANYWVFETGEIGRACALPEKGIHSPSWNKKAFGIEMVADFDGTDDPESKGGAVIFDTTAFIFATILKKCGLPHTAIKLHKEDTATTHDCPGKLVSKTKFIARVKEYMDGFRPSVADDKPTVVTTYNQPNKDRVKSTDKAPTDYPIREVQKLVSKAGFNPGALDGLWGPKTEKAVKDFQKSKGLKVDGFVGPLTWAALNKQPVEAPKPAPVPEAPKPEAPRPVEKPVEHKPVEPKDQVDLWKPVEELHPSEYCVSWMKRFEGLRLKAYDDVGSWAIGYGHNATSKRAPIPYEGMTITEEEANKILHADAEAIGAEVRKVLKGCKVTQDMFDAFTLDNFQRGQTQFTKTPVVKAIKEGGDWLEAFTKQATHANAGVTRRRKVQVLIAKGEKPTKW